jgi:hypothetical protein
MAGDLDSVTVAESCSTRGRREDVRQRCFESRPGSAPTPAGQRRIEPAFSASSAEILLACRGALRKDASGGRSTSYSLVTEQTTGRERRDRVTRKLNAGSRRLRS